MASSARVVGGPAWSVWDVDGDGYDCVPMGVLTDDVDAQIVASAGTCDEHPLAPRIVFQYLTVENGVKDIFRSQTLFVRLQQSVLAKAHPIVIG